MSFHDGTLPLIAGTVLLALLSSFIVLFVGLYRKAQLKFHLERQQFQQALLEAEIEIRKETLDNVARDLHDNLGQIASLISINMNLMEMEIPTEHHSRLVESKQLLSQLIRDMRKLTTSLFETDFRQIDLPALIGRDLDRIRSTGFIKVDFESTSDLLDLPSDKALFLYRIFQEMINNVLKHSNASELTIRLISTKSTLTLSVKDNGRGIAPERKEGNGLSGIRERCSLIGANITLESSENKGTFMAVVLPIAERDANPDSKPTQPDHS